MNHIDNEDAVTAERRLQIALGADQPTPWPDSPEADLAELERQLQEKSKPEGHQP